MIVTKVYVGGGGSEKIHSEASAFQIRVKGSLRSGLIIFKYVSGLTGLCQPRKCFLESDSLSPTEGGDSIPALVAGTQVSLVPFHAPHQSGAWLALCHQHVSPSSIQAFNQFRASLPVG